MGGWVVTVYLAGYLCFDLACDLMTDCVREAHGTPRQDVCVLMDRSSHGCMYIGYLYILIKCVV